MEQEAREFLNEALRPESFTGKDLVDVLRWAFEPLNGVELELPPREPGREPPAFD